MIREIRFSEEFDRAFKRLKKRYRSLPDDVKKLLESLVENPEQGVELYNGMRKVRISFASKASGKRGGGRVIIQLAVTEDCLTFVYPFPSPPRERLGWFLKKVQSVKVGLRTEAVGDGGQQKNWRALRSGLQCSRVFL